MGRTSDARERLIDTARELMHNKGFGAVGVGEICARAGVNKGSFYYFFESKRCLGLAAIDAYTESGKAMWAEIAGSDVTALERLEQILALPYVHGQAQKRVCNKVQGCMLGNLALEQSTQDPQIQARIEAAFDAHLGVLERILADAVEEGVLPTETDVASKAQAALCLLEGFVMLAKVKNDPQLLRDLPRQVIALMRS